MIKILKDYFSSYFSKDQEISDEEKRRFLYEYAKAGHKYDQFAYGYYCLVGFGGPINLGHAEYWLNKAAHAGISEAQLTLGECYYDGHILEKNIEKANFWLIIAATNGEEDAKRYLKDYKTTF